jgi:uncharacterized sulfatase
LFGLWLLGLGISQAAPERPNIILVFIDDMGWGDFSCFGNSVASTPNIDRLAAEGVRFEQFYVNSPICSPSRVAISTGQYPQRWKISSFLANRHKNELRGMAQWLDPAAPMLARSLKASGYATGHFGKWHMGGQRDVDDAPPITDYGFDVFLTNFEGMGPKLLPLTLKPGQDPANPGRIWADAERLGEGVRWMQRSEITGGFVDEAIAFAREAAANGKPFYINLWPDDVHTPLWPPVDSWADNPQGLYKSVLEAMDRQLGPLFELARSTENPTLILACSDNGPEARLGSAGPFRGYKTFLYEGGIRSSLVAWGPGILKATPGTVDTTSVFSAIDLVPTLLDLSNTRHPDGASFDGESLVGTLTGSHPSSRQAPIHFRRPPDRDSFYGVDNLPDLATRSGKWKLLCEYDGSRPELYDLQADPGETTNLASAQPDVVATLTTPLLAWHTALPEDAGTNSFLQPNR